MALSQSVPITRVLVSVSDKGGLEKLAAALKPLRVQWFSTGGTADYLTRECGVQVQSIESLTQFPEMMHGRVKTLHPKVFGGILARRGEREDLEACEKFGIPLFDLVVVNLYPFENYINRPTEEQIDFVDIGGPSLIRAAAKNHPYTTVLSDPSDYDGFLAELEANQGKVSYEFRKKQAAKTFLRTSQYDSMIASEWMESEFPASVPLYPQTPLRYGENPHQKAVWAGPNPPPWKYLQGKELSYNNLLDAEAAVFLTSELPQYACSIIKHNNPCGVAMGKSPKEAFEKALSCDPQSAFGGIVSFCSKVDAATAEALAQIFLEVIIAPSFEPGALSVLEKKKNLRLIEWKSPKRARFEIRNAMAGYLVQDKDSVSVGEFKTVTKTQVPQDLVDELKFAWTVAKSVRSNAIVITENGKALGVGAGQMSRVDSVKIALEKTKGKIQNAVLASDAFFPFRDNIDLLKGSAVKAIIQPGGSQRDAEVIDACNEHGIAMVFTGCRHFRH